MNSTNPEGYWFKRRRYGWGWTPVTWQGWVAIAVFVIGIVGAAILIGEDRMEESAGWLIAWFAWLAVMTAALLIVTLRHGPKGKWRWGASPDDNAAEDI